MQGSQSLLLSTARQHLLKSLSGMGGHAHQTTGEQLRPKIEAHCWALVGAQGLSLSPPKENVLQEPASLSLIWDNSHQSPVRVR